MNDDKATLDAGPGFRGVTLRRRYIYEENGSQCDGR
jgi:hypothetical protein